MCVGRRGRVAVAEEEGADAKQGERRGGLEENRPKSADFVGRGCQSPT